MQHIVGQPYTPLNNIKSHLIRRGSFYQAFESPETQDKHIFVLAMEDITSQEKRMVEEDDVFWGMYTEDEGNLLVVILDIGGECSLISEAPFNVRCIPPSQLSLPEVILPNHQIEIELHLVELSDNTLVAKRNFTLPPDLSRMFFEKVHSQFLSTIDTFDDEYNNYMRFPVEMSLQKIPRFLLKSPE